MTLLAAVALAKRLKISPFYILVISLLALVALWHRMPWTDSLTAEQTLGLLAGIVIIGAGAAIAIGKRMTERP